VWHVLGDLESDGALAGDDVDVVERWDVRAPGLLDQLQKPFVCGGVIWRLEVDGGAVRPGRRDLARIRARGHDDEAVDSLARRGPGHRLRVVARRPGDDPPGLLVRAQRCQLGQYAPRLER